MDKEIKKAIEVMRSGGVILYPTDTVWGIGCDATNEDAVSKVYKIKKRVESKAMILLVDSIVKVESYIADVPDVAWDLTELSEKPITIIYENARYLPKNIVSEDGTIAMRVTYEEFSKKLCERMKVPIVSTSANVSGEATPMCFSDISDNIINAVDYVVNFRQEDKKNPNPSSIIKLGRSGEIKIIRE